MDRYQYYYGYGFGLAFDEGEFEEQKHPRGKGGKFSSGGGGGGSKNKSPAKSGQNKSPAPMKSVKTGKQTYAKGAEQTDAQGYTVSIRPFEHSGGAGGPQGDIFVRAPSGKEVKSTSHWMDTPEPGWTHNGVDLFKDWQKNEAAGTPEKSIWRTQLPLEKRLEMEANQQATAHEHNKDYGTLKDQFANYQEVRNAANQPRRYKSAEEIDKELRELFRE